MIAHKKERRVIMKMKTKTMGMFALLMIALSVVGFTYSTWSDTVQIEGTAKMCSLTLGFEQGTEVCYDNEFDGVIPTEIEDHFGVTYPPVEKEVAECTVVGLVEEEDPHTGKKVWKKQTITVKNAYPSLWVFVVKNLKNAGKVPIHITSVTITGKGGLIWDEAQMCFWKDFDGDGVKDPDEIIINFGVCKVDEAMPQGEPPKYLKLTEPLVSNQIDPCECLWILIWMHFKEDAEECTEYAFDIEIKGVQWNKAP